MPRKRNKLLEWAQRTKDELNGIGGLAGLGGTALGAGGLTFLSGTAAVMLSGGGAIILVGAVGYAAYRAFPQPSRQAEDAVGKTVTLQDLELFDPPLTTAAIVGTSMAGKTTLRSRMAFEQAENVRTQVVSAKIVSLQTAPQTYLAILDGGGEIMAQQFVVAAKSEILIVVADHNASDNSSSIDPERLNETGALLNQVKLYLDHNNCPKKRLVVFLLNKSDLWSRASNAHEVDEFYRRIVDIWKSANKANSIMIKRFSNNNPSDLALLMSDLKAFVGPGSL